jgi:hypothetical protein
MLRKNDSNVVLDRSFSIISTHFGSRVMKGDVTLIPSFRAHIILKINLAKHGYPAIFKVRAKDDPWIGEPITTTLLTISGC